MHTHTHACMHARTHVQSVCDNIALAHNMQILELCNVQSISIYDRLCDNQQHFLKISNAVQTKTSTRPGVLHTTSQLSHSFVGRLSHTVSIQDHT